MADAKIHPISETHSPAISGGPRTLFADFGGLRRPGFAAVCFNAEGADGGGAAEPGAGGSGAEAPARPDYIPESFWDAQTGAVKVDELGKAYGELAKFKAEQDARLAGLPAGPDGYEISIPRDIVPEGLQIEVDATDPLIQAVRSFAFEHRVPPAALQGLVNAHVQATLAQLDADAQAIQAAHARLGEKAPARIKSVTDFATANLPKDQADALRSAVHTADGDKVVAALEALIAKTNRTLPSGQPAPTKLSADEYDRMSPAERLAYARRATAKN